MKKHSKNVVTSQEIVNHQVLSCQEELLGRIIEIVIDKEAGVVKYLVLEIGSATENKLFAIPWPLVHYLKTRDMFMLAISGKELQHFGNFKDHWPDEAMDYLNLSSANRHKQTQFKVTSKVLEQLQKIAILQPGQTQKEIFQDMDVDGFNHNPSEQSVYPGIQIHKAPSGSAKG